MVKKTLKNALRAHESKKAQAAKVKKVEEAAQRKAASIRAGNLKAGGKVRRAKEPVKEETATVTSTAARRRNRARPFEHDDTVLLVGEGNFSFAHALLLPPYNHPPSRVLATAFDSEGQCYEKYPDAAKHVREIRRIAVRDDIVLFGIDAGDLLAHKAVRLASAALNAQSSPASWSKIVFNFPHVGAGHKDERRNVMANQLLILRFLISAAPLLSHGELPRYVQSGTMKRERKLDDGDEDEDEDEASNNDEDTSLEAGMSDADRPKSAHTARTPAHKGSVLITLRNCKPYTLWDVPSLAKRMPSVWQAIMQGAPSPAKGQKMPNAADVDAVVRLGGGHAYRVWRSFAFDPYEWQGYAHRHTIGWRDGLSKADNEDILRSEQGECRTWQLGLAG